MPTQFWSKAQDQRCIDQTADLKQQLEALGKVVEELAAENGKLRAELQTRSTVWDNELSEMETRLIGRFEAIEDRLSQPADYSGDEGKSGDSSSGGYTKWSEKKAAAAASERDDSVWTKPRPKKSEPAPQEK